MRRRLAVSGAEAECFQEVTNEEAYDAEEAGLIFDISNTSGLPEPLTLSTHPETRNPKAPKP